MFTDLVAYISFYTHIKFTLLKSSERNTKEISRAVLHHIVYSFVVSQFV